MATKQFLARHGFITTANSDFTNVNITTTLTVNNSLSTNGIYIGMGSMFINTTAIGFGSNVVVNTTRLFIGNSTVNATVNSTSFALNGVAIGSGAAGSNTQVQFNDSGVANGSSGLVFNKSTSNLAITGTFNVSGLATLGDLTVNNVDATISNGTSNTGTLYLGNTGTRYLTYDGGNYSLPGAALFVNGASVWTTGNDGSGSNLDADLLDGYQATAFARFAAAPTFTAGPITLSTGSTGQVALVSGSASTTGYISFSNTSGSRKGYLGFAAESGALNLYANENGAIGLSIQGNTSVTGTLGCSGLGSIGTSLSVGTSLAVTTTIAGGNTTITGFVNATSTITSGGTITGTAFNTSSDISLKTDVQDLPVANIQAVALRSYKMKEEGGKWGKKRKVGVIAQEVEKVFPDVVFENPGTGLKTVDYMQLAIHFMRQVQEQDKYIADLESRVSLLEID